MTRRSDLVISGLIDARMVSFSNALDAICENIVSTRYCQLLDSPEKRIRELRDIESMIRRYMESEQSAFISYIFRCVDCEDDHVPEKSDRRIDAIISCMKDPRKAKRLTATKLVNNFFFEASFVKSNCLNMRQVILQFSAAFTESFREFRQSVRSAMMEIEQSQKRAIHTVTDAVKEKQRELDEMSGRLETLSSRIDKMVKPVDAIAVEELMKQLEDEVRQHLNTKQRLEVAEEELLSVKHALDDLHEVDGRNRVLMRKYHNLMHEFEKVRDENQQLTIDLVDRTDRVRGMCEMKHELEDRTMQLEFNKKQLAEARRENKEMGRMIAGMKLENQTLKEQLVQQASGKPDSRTTDVELENEALKEQLAKQAILIKEVLGQKIPADSQSAPRIELIDRSTQISFRVPAPETPRRASIATFPISRKHDGRDAKEQLGNNEQDSIIESTETAESHHSDTSESIRTSKATKSAKKQTVENVIVTDHVKPIEKMRAQAVRVTRPVRLSGSVILLDLPEEESIPLASVTEERNEMEAQLQQMRNKVKFCEKALSDETKKVSNLVAAFASAKADMARATRTIASKDAELELLAEKEKDMQLEIQERDDENESLTRELRNMFVKRSQNEKMAALTKNRDALEVELRTTKQSHSDVMDQLSTAKHGLMDKEACINKLNNRIAVMKRQMLALQTAKTEAVINFANRSDDVIAENERLREEAEELQTRADVLQQANSKLETLLYSAMNGYEAEVGDISQKMRVASRAGTLLANSFEAEKRALTEKIASIRRKRKHATMHVEDLERCIERQRIRYENADRKLKAQRAVISELRYEVSELQVFHEHAGTVIFGDSGRHTVKETLKELRRLKHL